MNGWLDARTVGNKGGLLCALAAAALVMAVAGPFGQSERFLPSHRLGLWLLYLAAALPILGLVLTGLRRWLRAALGLAGASALVASPPILVLVEVIGLLEGRPLPQTGADWIRSVAEVAVLVLPFAVLLERLLRPAAVLAPAHGQGNALDGLGIIHAVCAEGHYARVFASSGEHFLDESFSSLLEHLADRDGTQVHRSWWVARDAVKGQRRRGSSAMLTLSDGRCVPVARRRISRLRAEGWPV